MSVRLTKAQRVILEGMKNGEPFCEYLTPDHSQLFFRTLGDQVRARLNYVIDGRRVGYKTFWKLFKFNLIQPSKYKGSRSPQGGITQFHLTQRGREVING